jgi:hypothetical protein
LCHAFNKARVAAGRCERLAGATGIGREYKAKLTYLEALCKSVKAIAKMLLPPPDVGADACFLVQRDNRTRV